MNMKNLLPITEHDHPHDSNLQRWFTLCYNQQLPMRSPCSVSCLIFSILYLPERNLLVPRLLDQNLPHLPPPKLDEDGAHSLPEMDVEPQHQAPQHREHDGNQKIHKERHEGPTSEGENHEDDDDHVGHHPRYEEAPVVQDATKHQHQAEKEMNHGAPYDSSQDHPVVHVHPVKPLPDHPGDLMFGEEVC